MTALLFAVAHEAATVLAELTKTENFLLRTVPVTVGYWQDQPVTTAIIGMGAATAKLRTEIFLTHFRPQRVILAGYAGALQADLQHAEVLVAENYLIGDWPPLRQLRSARLSSATTVVTDRTSREVFAQISGAQMVDMETAAVAEIVTRFALPFCSLRAISDTLEDNLPLAALASSFDLKTQTPTPWKLLQHLLRNPRDLHPFIQFVQGLSPARRALTQALRAVIQSEPLTQ
jgi:adenosylhomocysteine nucleosidase